MTKKTIIFVLFLFFVYHCTEQEPVMKIAFGSCGYQDEPLPVFNEIVKHQPDLFIFLGDNIYSDTNNMDTLRAKYQRLGAKESFQNLKNHVEILATWDDHDYGKNDAGRHYPFKKESKEIFMDFFDEPVKSERRNHEGIYESYEYNLGGKIVQIILLDTRTFRDNLQNYQGEMKNDSRYFYSLDYSPYLINDSTMLGEKQWAWLDQQLQKNAYLRIIGSSTQFGIEYNGYEAWANFPLEQKRFLNLIKKNKASGILFISGDVHYAEISRLDFPDLYPIYDITSSGLSSTWDFATPNKNRIKGPVMDNNFGLLTIAFNGSHPNIKAEIWDVRGNQRIEYTIPLHEIYPSH
ncbi:MAG: alkaline phosphatase D family protein [Fidelibacterota bacterium]